MVTEISVVVVTKKLHQNLIMVLKQGAEVGIGKLVMPQLLGMVSGATVNVTSNEEFATFFSISELLFQPVKLCVTFLRVLGDIIICRKVQSVQAKNRDGVI